MPVAAAVRLHIRVEVRPEGGRAAGVARFPSSEGDAAGSVIAAESAPCGVLAREETCWATVAEAGDASAEPMLPSIGTDACTIEALFSELLT